MIAVANNSVEYFRQYNNYFWQWAEGGNVIEWKHGKTICYTKDFVLLMKALTNSGLPSFGSVLLILTACNDSWTSTSEAIGILYGLKQSLDRTEGDCDDDVLDYYINQAVKCINMITALPQELKQGMQRAHLLHEVCKKAKIVICEDDLRGAADDLLSGRLQPEISNDYLKITWHKYKEDLECMVGIFHRYSLPAKLERQLRTGLFEMPPPAPIALPPPTDLPAVATGYLLKDLAAEHKTAGIAALAKRLIAALNIPMHSQGSSDQLFGGVSDITNRGNFDRLLLSELAYDDNVLLARLANNEALYLRREELPAQPKNKRVILVDATLKMWGMPRVFAISAAIACTLNVKHGETIEAFVLGGSEAIPADTNSVGGINKALAILDPDLHCFAALKKYCLAKLAGNKTDTFFISLSDTVHAAGFQQLLAEYPSAFNFIITVGRDGQMICHEVINGRLKKVSAAKFDVEDILNTENTTKGKKLMDLELPAFFHQEVAPLLFPTTALRPLGLNSFYHKKPGVVAVTESMRLLHWPMKDKGASELLSTIEQGTYAFGYDGEDLLFVLVNIERSPGLILYTINIGNGVADRFELDIEKKGVVNAVYNSLHFYMRTNPKENNNVVIINCTTGKVEGSKPFEFCAHIFISADQFPTEILTGNIKKYINNGYNVLHRVKSVGTTLPGILCIDKKIITVPTLTSNHLTLKFFEHTFNNRAQKVEEKYFKYNIGLDIFSWADGSKAMIDSRGFLHLVSSNALLPQVTFVLIENKACACWSSDGKVAGNPYFLSPKRVNGPSTPIDFYTNYIAPIIKHINEA